MKLARLRGSLVEFLPFHKQARGISTEFVMPRLGIETGTDKVFSLVQVDRIAAVASAISSGVGTYGACLSSVLSSCPGHTVPCRGPCGMLNFISEWDRGQKGRD